ncbi:hypothetical protein [Streptomyces sp. NBC_01445]|uniref:hypothetical protein n=1 Tax=Streptomyces sp. NBC_01445 TaxID=2903869 RepID=UPI002DD8B0F7|nr:hypothetical protein [Streptomyces sp. NBC_01445]WSE05993.1 hypothetical protein OG574_23135 [Streptomyces sp. NBC_01445]
MTSPVHHLHPPVRQPKNPFLGRVLRPGGTLVCTVRHAGDAHYGTGTAHGDDIYERAGFAEHFFPRTLVDTVANGRHLKEVHAFEEGALPRRLWCVTQTLPR